MSRIVRVIVDETNPNLPDHCDEAIEQSLWDLRVEVLDWRKLDLCPETILRASPEVEELYLLWSGSNAVLRGWSEPQGLACLEKLTKIHLLPREVLSLLLCYCSS